MYDILFICKHCGVHLSADENDVGAAFPCPECAQALTIPVGDILFDCPKCGKSLLASRSAVRQQFHCPSCQRLIVIPPIGKTVPVSDKIELISPLPALAPLTPPPVGAQLAEPGFQGIEQARPLQNPPPAAAPPADAADKRFLATWGDYLAEAGLADDKPPPLKPPPSES